MKKKYENLTIQEAFDYLQKGKRVTINGLSGHWKIKKNKLAFVVYTVPKYFAVRYEINDSNITYEKFVDCVKYVHVFGIDDEKRFTSPVWGVVKFPLLRRIKYSISYLIRMMKIRMMGKYFLQGLCYCPPWINEDDCGDIT